MWILPILSAAVGYVIGVAALPLLGFTAAGVAASSFAAFWQSCIGYVAAGSVFALFQSAAATGVGATVGGALGTAIGAGVPLIKYLVAFL